MNLSSYISIRISLAKELLNYCFLLSKLLNMPEFQSMHKYFTIFLAIVACHGSLFVHGRHIKPLNQHSSLNANPTLAPLRATINNVVHTPSEDQLKATEAPIVQKYEFADADSGGSGVGYADSFQPTTPGHSPGVGHNKIDAEDDKDVKVNGVLLHSPHVNVPMAEEKDFRPTNPGHSPGVGHR
ncbi:unnamed protein product [Sphenostylis stenocarpa]|uniref:Uncharacterized protein n=1 Tax=Sphenostylis stenocarpa TaxID=92480 RepID=A0AA86SHW5_9FABA|nr:unnamed protein product [Sphenostylis stenocarpa]